MESCSSFWGIEGTLEKLGWLHHVAAAAFSNSSWCNNPAKVEDNIDCLDQYSMELLLVFPTGLNLIIRKALDTSVGDQNLEWFLYFLLTFVCTLVFDAQSDKVAKLSWRKVQLSDDLQHFLSTACLFCQCCCLAGKTSLMMALMLGCMYPDTLPPSQFMLIRQNLGPKSLYPLMLHRPGPSETRYPPTQSSNWHVSHFAYLSLLPRPQQHVIIGSNWYETTCDTSFHLIVDFSCSYLVAINTVPEQKYGHLIDTNDG